MKKIITTLLTLALMCTCMTAVFAEEDKVTIESGTGNLDDNTSNRPVNIIVTGNPLFKIDITWEDLDFKYSFSKWDTTNHRYNEGSSWNKNSSKITLNNHSNSAVKYDISFAQGSQNYSVAEHGVTAEIANPTGTLASAECGHATTQDSVTKVNVTGTPDSMSLGTFTIGTVYVQLKK